MIRVLAAIAAILLNSPVFAADAVKPNTLTDKEIADGWLLVFDGESTFGWTTGDKKDGKLDSSLAVKDGALVLAGKGKSARLATLFQFFELTGEYRTAAKGCRIVVRYHAPNDKKLEVSDALAPAGGEWRPLRARFTPKEAVVQAGGSGFNGPAPSDELADIGFSLASDDGASVEVRNLKLRPLGERSLFDGKSLTGWSINKADPKRMASKWEPKDGELSLTNGPGDLVSDAQFGDFVIQLECKTLSPAANSGVFFRCIPGQYQNGYEAQIQNAYKENDRTKPLDFGTGAIYRRIPARKVMSNDNEWFTMTVVATGRHIATWVNGYATVDWTDDRTPDDNPRKGYRAAPGPISLQGHDPTTHIQFRNIRIAELPAKK